MEELRTDAPSPSIRRRWLWNCLDEIVAVEFLSSSSTNSPEERSTNCPYSTGKSIGLEPDLTLDFKDPVLAIVQAAEIDGSPCTAAVLYSAKKEDAVRTVPYRTVRWTGVKIEKTEREGLGVRVTASHQCYPLVL
jgi:hypothetical protein